MSDTPDAQQASPQPPPTETAATSRPKSSPAMLWIAGLLTLVVAVVVIAGIVNAQQASEDCLEESRRAASDVYAKVDYDDPQSLRRAASDLDDIAYYTGKC